MSDRITFYHNPMSRGRIVHWMLEEAGATYDIKLLDLEKHEQKSPEYLAINPMGKVPAIVHRGIAITEAAAICAYLADAFPQAGLAPAVDDPARGTYYRWFFFAASCLEAAATDKAFARELPRESMLGYGNYENVMAAIEKAVTPGPFVLGERFSAADVYLGAQVSWGLMMKSIEPRPALQSYAERCTARPAYQRMLAASG
jgi:glutathione S-transferase